MSDAWAAKHAGHETIVMKDGRPRCLTCFRAAMAASSPPPPPPPAPSRHELRSDCLTLDGWRRLAAKDREPRTVDHILVFDRGRR